MYVRVNQFDGGMASDPRDPRENVCRLCEHFVTYENKFKLTPSLSFESGDSSASTNLIGNYAFDGTTVYGLGDNHSGIFKIYKRTDFTGNTWSNDASGSSPFNPYDASMLPFFVYYKTTGKLYGAGAGDGTVGTNRYIWSVTPGSTFNQKASDLSGFTTVSNGLVHSKDDILYVGYDNKIAKNNNDTWTTAALTLPSRYIVTSICEFGNYLAIGCRPVGVGNSRVFLWNRDSSVTTLDESLDWGAGNLMVLEELEGYLVGVSFDTDTATGANFKNTRISLKYYDGRQVTEFNKLIGSSSSPAISACLFKFKSRGRILFPATIPVDSTGYAGIWSISRSSSNVPFAITLEYLNKSIGANSGVAASHLGLIQIADCLFSSYNNRESGSEVLYMDKVDDAVVYTTTSVYQTTVNPKMSDTDRPLIKQVMAMGLTYEPLPSGASITLKYRKNGGSWITAFTETTTGKVSTLIERGSDGVEFGKAEEWEFRVESTGGGEITSIPYRYDVVANPLSK